MPKPSISRQLSKWAAEVPPMNNPDALSIARDAFADTIACMFGGLTNEGVQKLIQINSSWDASGTNVVFGTQRRFNTPTAALINGAAAHALDFDDNYIPAFTHASAVMVPALLAIGGQNSLSGKSLLDAYIVGAELHTRIGLLVNPGHFNQGWHSTATVGTIGTAGACARLLGLDETGICTAMSIGFSLAAGSKKQFGTMMKPIHAGLAAQHAVMAAGMASVGISANLDFLTGPFSFQDHYATTDLSRESRVLKGLGSGLCLSKYGLLVKRFPCCGSAHKSLDGFLHLREKHQTAPENIKQATTWLPETMSRNLPFDHPKNEMEGRFSLHYNAARILLEGSLSLRHFTKEAVFDPEILGFLSRICRETIPDPEDINPTTPLLNRIELVDGRVFEYEVEHLKGSLQIPLSPADIKNKFEDCVRFAGIDDFPEELYAKCAGLGDDENIKPLMDQVSRLMP